MGLALLAAVALGCAAALHGQNPVAARVTIGAAWLAIALGPLALPALGRNSRMTGAMLAALGVLWFAGFDSPFHWDAVQTVIRAEHFWHTREMERFSILFALLAPIVAIFPANAAAPHFFMMTCGLFALAAMAAMARRVAGQAWARRTFLLAMALPPIWLLYRYVMLEAFLVMMWSVTLLAAMAWSRQLTPWRAAGLAALVLLTAATKETGALIVVPVMTALVALAPREARRRRWIFALALGGVAAVVGVIVAARFAQLRNIDSFFSGVIHTDRGLTFLPFNSHLKPAWNDIMVGMAWQHVFYWAQSGLIVPALLAFVQPRRRHWGAWLIGLGAAAQVLCSIATPHDQQNWPDVHTFPLFSARMSAGAAGLPLMFAIFALFLVARGEARWRCDRRALVLAMSVLPFIAALMIFAKAAPTGGGRFYVWLQWHYLSPAIVGALVLAVMGLRRAARWPMPPWLRWAAGAAIVAVMANGLIGTMGIAARWRGEDMARLDAYRAISAPDAPLAGADPKIVYTHWPFAYLGTGIGYHNNGPLAWERDGWTVLALSDVATTGAVPLDNSVMLYDVSRGYGIKTYVLRQLGGHVSHVEREAWRPSLRDIGFPVERKNVIELRCVEGPCVALGRQEKVSSP